jgi:xylulose-5-phosphate/fructose-6-phosphate phosphoketolase
VHHAEKLIAKRKNRNFQIKGYTEEGTISTAFDMTVINDLECFHLMIYVCDAIESNCQSMDLKAKWMAHYVQQEMQDLLTKHKQYIHKFGVDMYRITL